MIVNFRPLTVNSAKKGRKGISEGEILPLPCRLQGRKFLKWLAAKWWGGFDWGGIGEQEDCAGAVFGLRIL